MVRRPDLGYQDEGLSLTDAATYAEACRDFGQALVLPHVAYRSLQFLYLEDESLWSRCWIPVGTRHEIPAKGDLLPFSLGYHGVHVQNMGEGRYAARFNLAQHGGCRVVPGQCQGGKRTACHFSSCGYSRDRGPISAQSPEGENGAMHQFVGLRPERLYPVQVGQLGALIFLNIDPDEGHEPAAMPVDPGLPLPATVASGTALRAHREWREFHSNWKFAAQSLADCDEVLRTGESWLSGRRTALTGQRISVLWLFPNLVILTSGAESCVTVLQHTAIGQVLFRSEILSESPVSPGRIAFWQAELQAAGTAAVALQNAVPVKPALDPEDAAPALQRSEAALWGQKALVQRIVQMPALTTEIPIFKSVEHYLR